MPNIFKTDSPLYRHQFGVQTLPLSEPEENSWRSECELIHEARSYDDLSHHINLAPEDYLLFLHDPNRYVKTKTVKKAARRQARVIRSYSNPIRHSHKRIAWWASKRYIPPQLVTGFIKKSSHITNAHRHLGAAVVTVVDIESFFDSISAAMIEAAFRFLGCNELIARALTNICTIEQQLPQGGRASPVLSNVVCRDLDKDLAELADNLGLRVSRYVDDITFSGARPVGHHRIADLLKNHGFRIKRKSYREQKKGGPQFTTGLSVGDHTDLKVRLPRQYKNRLEATLRRLHLSPCIHDGLREIAQSLGDDEGVLLRRLKGHLDYANSVEPEWSATPRELYDDIAERHKAEAKERS